VDRRETEAEEVRDQDRFEPRRQGRVGPADIVDGAFFDNFRADRHIIKPFQIPKDWLRFRAGDWGFAKPFSFGWCAVASEPFIAALGLLIPRGALVRYKEWYGISTDGDGRYIPNKGLKMTAEKVGSQVRVRDGNDTMSYGVLDPAAFA